MKPFKSALYVLLFVVQFPVSGLEIKTGYIRDFVKHELNQRILKSIIIEELALQPEDKAYHLSSRIVKIGRELLAKGFEADAYGVPESDANSILAFNCFALWEGEKEGPIPLTFFVYVWPSREHALRYNETSLYNCRFATPIHSHPIPCAFSVLQGNMIQSTFEEVSSIEKSVRLLEEKEFRIGEGEFDDLQKGVIHQLYYQGGNMGLTLHAYGLPSAEKVMACFQKTRAQCTFDKIVKE